MARIVLICATLCILTPNCFADEQNETVIRLTVQPAAAPTPALRYQLLPELREMNPGNPVLGYLRCFSDAQHFFFSKASMDKRDKWMELPLKDLPLKEIHDAGYAKGSRYMTDADSAARLETPDWQVLLLLQKSGAKVPVPEIQQMRVLATALQMRFRAEIAEKRFDDAIITAKTMFALARHLGEHPTTIGYLVGRAIAFLPLPPLEEMLCQPGCPNLFWALTNLPSPLVDSRKGIQGERQIYSVEFQCIDEKSPMSEDQLGQAIRRIQQLMDYVPKDKRINVREWLVARAKDSGDLAPRIQRLVKNGLAAERIKLFPAMQVILIDEKNQFESHQDEWMKVFNLPYWQIDTPSAETPESRKLLDNLLFGNLISSKFNRGTQSQVRLEQRLGLLRCVEALRIYAADHQGKLPAKLDDIKLPLPVDPISGQAFIYRLEGTTAILQGRPPRGQEKNESFNVRYEIKIAQ